jgi:hypothetical protein
MYLGDPNYYSRAAQQRELAELSGTAEISPAGLLKTESHQKSCGLKDPYENCDRTNEQESG